MPTGVDGGDRKRKAESGSVSEAAFHGNLSAERLHKAAHEGEAKSSAALRHGVESIEDAAQA
jgi:hypothetical protein